MTVTITATPSEVAKLQAKAERDKYEDKLAGQLDGLGIEYVRQFRFHPVRRWLADFRIGDLIVEVDGGGYMQGKGHFSEHGRRHDNERDRAATILGYRVMRFTGSEVKDGTAVRVIEDEMRRVA